ncbi:MAG: hypothetical protein JNL54_08760, partial [Kineosporiaceae bacterium]|nr:hypothetical protein [Kineosporiaceae bacterium]
SRGAAVCVITVDDGPDGVRWARVSLRSPPDQGDEAIQRSQHLTPGPVLAEVARFLAEAGLLRGDADS